MKKILIFLFPVFILFASCKGNSDAFPADAQRHHLFPNEMRGDFAVKGIDVDKFIIPVPGKDHQGYLHSNQVGWNSQWRDFFDQKPNASQKDIYNQAERMLSKAGYRGEFKFYDYSTRELSGATLGGSGSMIVMSQNGFWRFVGGIGNWLMHLFGENSPFIGFLASFGAAVLSLFGIKAGNAVTIGIGFLAIVFCLLSWVGIIYLMFQIGILKGLLVLLGINVAGFFVVLIGSFVLDG